MTETLHRLGQVDATLARFVNLRQKQAKTSTPTLQKHKHQIVNHAYYQTEGICSIDTGAVEFVIRHIGCRIQISEAQWKAENVPQMFAHCTAYLNNLLLLKRGLAA